MHCVPGSSISILTFEFRFLMNVWRAIRKAHQKPTRANINLKKNNKRFSHKTNTAPLAYNKTAQSCRLVTLLAITTNTMQPFLNPHFSVSGVPDVDPPPRDTTIRLPLPVMAHTVEHLERFARRKSCRFCRLLRPVLGLMMVSGM
jgi:hypothetical protein